MSKITPVFLTISVLAFGTAFAAANIDFSSTPSEEDNTTASAVEQAEVTALGDELQAEYGIEFTREQLTDLRCDTILFSTKCYEGPIASGTERFGSTEYTKPTGEVVTINLYASPEGPLITEDTAG